MSKRSENFKMFGAISFIAVMLMYGGIVLGEGQHFVNPAEVLFKWFFGIG